MKAALRISRRQRELERIRIIRKLDRMIELWRHDENARCRNARGQPAASVAIAGYVLGALLEASKP